MEEGRSSATAVASAMVRAAHLLLDEDPKIFQDPLALRLSGFESEAALHATLEAISVENARRSTPEMAEKLYSYARAITVLRQRYTEDELDKALAQGVAQYVILGAGLDSFAYRRPDLARTVRVFEVDHPATQQWKRTRLQALALTPPSNLTFVPIDFEQQTLADELRASGHRSELPTFFSWLGVTMYLTEEAVFETLRYVASLAPGSEIVFQYVLPESLVDEENRRLLAVLKAFGAARGEPWLSAFEPNDLAARVKGLGFTEVWDFGLEEANARYFVGRTDGLYIRPMSNLLKARVGNGS
jgi:methyltransferase (TIGR00027 family)